MKNIIKTSSRGNLIVISGPSGAGKDTIVNELLKENENIWLSISATSRKPRSGEIDGIHYFFLTKEEFEERIKDNDFLEYASYNDNYYGTPKSDIVEKLNNGIDVVLVIEIQGALKVKELIPEAVFIFIMPPSMSELRRRLVDRKTEDKEKILKRFKTAYKEINEITKYNYVVINDQVKDAVDKVKAILLSEKCRVDRIEEVYLDNEEEEIHELLVDKNLENKDISF
ncbi:MAG: guanylate kinase [Bacilli bacterium]|nr:guanylate kinase [Bacilli bacterium]